MFIKPHPKRARPWAGLQLHRNIQSLKREAALKNDRIGGIVEDHFEQDQVLGSATVVLKNKTAIFWAGSSCDYLNRWGKGVSSGTPGGALVWDAADCNSGESLCWEQTPRERTLLKPLPAALLEGGEQGRF